jgi:RimJ/RimL family protein N-acetyltransferase
MTQRRSEEAHVIMPDLDPVLRDVPMPIRTPRLLLRPKQPGDGALTAEAVAETWEDLHPWMAWAERLEDNTAEKQEIRTRHVMAKFLLREEFNLLGIERATGRPVIWCGFHNIDWRTRQCETGFWVRRSAHNRGFATEATNALLRYAFDPLGMQRVGIAHAAGNERSRRVIVKLGFQPEGVLRKAMILPGNHLIDRHVYARFNTAGLPDLEVDWGEPSAVTCLSEADLASHLQALEEQLLDPATRASSQAVASLLTQNFREFGSSGRIFDREKILAELAHETPVRIALSDFHLQRLSSTAALVTYRSYRTTADRGTDSALRSSIWILEGDGKWRMQFHQGTKSNQPA